MTWHEQGTSAQNTKIDVVRHAQVLPRPSIDPTEAAARLAVTAGKPAGAKGGGDGGGGAISKAEDARYMGCFSSESFFGGKEYVGGASGANYNLIYHHAKQVRLRFLFFRCNVDILGSCKTFRDEFLTLFRRRRSAAVAARRPRNENRTPAIQPLLLRGGGGNK